MLFQGRVFVVRLENTTDTSYVRKKVLVRRITSMHSIALNLKGDRCHFSEQTRCTTALRHCLPGHWAYYTGFGIGKRVAFRWNGVFSVATPRSIPLQRFTRKLKLDANRILPPVWWRVEGPFSFSGFLPKSLAANSLQPIELSNSDQLT